MPCVSCEKQWGNALGCLVACELGTFVMLYRATKGIVGHENTQKMNGTLL